MDKIRPQQKILLTYIILILIGSLFLLLPWSLAVNTNYIDLLFTSVSAVTITGLSPIDITTNFTTFGKTVLAFLIQLGGLSITTIQIFILTLIGAKISYRDRDLVKENINVNSRIGIIKTIKRIIIITFTIELIGVVLLIPFFLNQGYNLNTSIGFSLFHTISSYNNAGFSIFDSNSLVLFSEDIYFNTISILLIVLGSIGTLVIFDISKNKRWKKLNLNSKIVLKMTFILFTLSAILFYLLEDNATIITSLFHAATIRTAGFYSFNYLNARNVTLLLTMIFMFIGGAPASTSGGIKVTTLYTLIKSVKSGLTNSPPLVGKKEISKEYIKKATLILLLSLFIIIISITILLVIENIDFLTISFEVISAFSNTGLSLNLTSSLNIFSKIIIMIVMLVGRVGIITFFISFIFVKNKNTNINYINAEYLI